MTLPNEQGLTPAALKAAIEAADRAAARGAPGEALRWLLGGRPAAIARITTIGAPTGGRRGPHLDEPCGDVAAPLLCGYCEGERHRERDSARDNDPIDYLR
jgi:hypothetical protein